MSQSKNLVVTTSGDRSMSEIEKELTDSGFAVDQVFEAIGSVTGKIKHNADIEKLRKIPGVTDVSEELPQVNIGPPDASIS